MSAQKRDPGGADRVPPCSVAHDICHSGLLRIDGKSVACQCRRKRESSAERRRYAHGRSEPARLAGVTSALKDSAILACPRTNWKLVIQDILLHSHAASVKDNGDGVCTGGGGTNEVSAIGSPTSARRLFSLKAFVRFARLCLLKNSISRIASSAGMFWRGSEDGTKVACHAASSVVSSIDAERAETYLSAMLLQT